MNWHYEKQIRTKRNGKTKKLNMEKKLNKERIKDYFEFKKEYELEIAHSFVVKIVKDLIEKYDIAKEKELEIALRLAEVFNTLVQEKKAWENKNNDEKNYEKNN